MVLHTHKKHGLKHRAFETLKKKKKSKHSCDKVLIADLCRVLPHTFQCSQNKWAATTAHRHSHSEIASKNAKWMHSQCGTKAVALMFVCWNCFKRPLNNEPKNSSTQSKDLPPHQVLTAVKDAVCGSKWRMERQPVVPTDLKIWKSMTLKCLRS